MGRADYSVVVKNRAPPPKAWRWEIYRAGNANPIKQSSIYFDTTAAARRAGKDALKELLNKIFNWLPATDEGNSIGPAVRALNQTRRAEPGVLQSLILFREHDRDNSSGDGGIGGIGRVYWHALIENSRSWTW
jgi:hypothetical protein